MVCSCALASDSDFATNNILLMRSCVHFREKMAASFPEMEKSGWNFSARPEKHSETTKKTMESPLIVFCQFLKERELDEDQLVLSKAKLRLRLYEIGRFPRSARRYFVRNKFSDRMIKRFSQNIVICQFLADQF